MSLLLATKKPFEFGNALRFDGVNDQVTFTNKSLTSTHAVSFWAKFDTFSSSRNVVLDADSQINYIYISSSSSIRVRDGVNDRTFNFASAMSTGTWYHIVLSVTAGSGRCYINGVESTSGALTLGANNFQYISRTGNFMLDADLDELAIWDGVSLTSGEVSSLYNSGNGEFAYRVKANPDRYYRFNSTSGTTAIDEGADGEDGSLNNFTGTYWVSH